MTSIRTRSGQKIIERLGTGIPTINAALDKAGMARPVFHDSGLQFTAIVEAGRLSERGKHAHHVTELPESKVNLALFSTNPSGKAILLALESEALAIKEITDATGLTIQAARYHLTRLRQQGLIVMEGARGSRDTRYRLVEKSWR